MLRSLDEKLRLRPDHTAVLLVDIQNDVCADDDALARTSSDVKLVQAVVEHAGAVLQTARETGVVPIFLRCVSDPEVESGAGLEKRMRRQGGSFRRWCAAGTWGSDFYALGGGRADARS